MWCPEISGDFPSCALGGCVLFGFCFVFGAGAKTFLPFISLVDLEHGAILEYSLATISELWIVPCYGCCSSSVTSPTMVAVACCNT